MAMSEEETQTGLMGPGAELVAQVREIHPNADIEKLQQAVIFARDAHEGQTRASGEPYYTHPVEVAQILSDMKLDESTIITAVLHDTVEDTDATVEDITNLFGSDVASLVDGVSKLSQIESKSVAGKQAENFRKLLVAMSEDIRVLLVKLADRLHNMRTLHHVSKPEKRQRIARETLEIYAPLAERIGMHQIKEELEDMAFIHMNPEARESISNRLSFLRQEGTSLVKAIIKELQSMLAKDGVEAEVTGREKTRYSIWRKMQRKNVAFEQLSDIMAFRIVVADVANCYRVLGQIHHCYPMVPGRFKDYISTPKPNGYKSIHTTIIGPQKQRIEIQIRTVEMHEEADLGVAAHWAYKQSDGQYGGVKEKGGEVDLSRFRWLRELLDILDQDAQPEDFLENTKLELYADRVYCFSPKGDLIELPANATPVDFAYAVHSGIGDTTVGAKVNGRIAPLDTPLQNGDQVEIHTSAKQTPNPSWERFVVSGKAKARIRRHVRLQQRDQYVSLGRAMLEKMFKGEGYTLNDKSIVNVAKQFQSETIEDVLAGIGQGNIASRDVLRAIFPAHKSKAAKKPQDIDLIDPFERAKKRDGSPMPIDGLIPGMAMHFARCCHPLPGDKIVGIVTTGKGVTIHTTDCDTLENFADTPERWLDVSWSTSSADDDSHVGRLRLTINNTGGALASLSNVIVKNGGNITNLKITNRSLDFWDMYIDVYVNDTKHLNNIVAALRATSEVTSVERAKGR